MADTTRRVLRQLTVCARSCGKLSSGICGRQFSTTPFFGAKLDFTTLLSYIVQITGHREVSVKVIWYGIILASIMGVAGCAGRRASGLMFTPFAAWQASDH